MSTSRCQNGSIGNRGNMVAANSACQYSSDGNNGQFIVITDYSQYDGNQDTESTPRSTGCKRKTDSNEEEHCRQEHTQSCIVTNNLAYITADVQVFFTANTGQGPSQAQNEECRSHCFKAHGETFTEKVELQHATGNIQEEGKCQCHEGTDYKTFRRVAICESLCHASTFKDATSIEHTENATCNQNKQGQYQVDDFAFTSDAFSFFILVFSRNKYFSTIFLFKSCHGCEVFTAPDKEHQENQSEPCIIVVRNGLQEQLETINFAIFRQGGAYCCSPAGNGSNNTNRCCSSVDDVSQFCTSNFKFISYRTHYSTNGQAVEVVINEDEHTQERSYEQSACFAFDAACCPFAISFGSTGSGNSCNQNAQQYKEHENVNVTANFCFHNGEHSINCRNNIKIAEHQRTG